MEGLREVLLPEAGEGVKLRFRLSGLRELQSAYGDKYIEIIMTGLLGFDIKMMEKCLQIAGFKDGEKYPISLDEVGDVEGITMEYLQGKILDAFSIQMNGRTYREHLAWITEEQKRQSDSDDRPQLP